MKKTREIEVSVEMFGDGTVRHVYLDKTSGESRAKLIVELPEEKIEITESILKQAFKKSGYGTPNYSYKALKKELGFKED